MTFPKFLAESAMLSNGELMLRHRDEILPCESDPSGREEEPTTDQVSEYQDFKNAEDIDGPITVRRLLKWFRAGKYRDEIRSIFKRSGRISELLREKRVSSSKTALAA